MPYDEFLLVGQRFPFVYKIVRPVEDGETEKDGAPIDNRRRNKFWAIPEDLDADDEKNITRYGICFCMDSFNDEAQKKTDACVDALRGKRAEMFPELYSNPK